MLIIEHCQANLEQYLANRRRWLWRKAIFMAKLVVKMAFRCKNKHWRSQTTQSEINALPSMGMTMGEAKTHVTLVI